MGLNVSYKIIHLFTHSNTFSPFFSAGNMMLFDADGVIKKYEGPEDILKEFYHLRMAYYLRRKAALLKVSLIIMKVSCVLLE